MPQVSLEIVGLGEIEAAIQEFTNPRCIGALMGPSLLAAARVVRLQARKKNFEFTDRTGRLRRSIRSRRIAARYLGRRVRGGQAAVFAGRQGARQAYLVHEGHGPPVGPQGSPPYRFLTEAVVRTQGGQATAFGQKAREVFPNIARRYIRAAGLRGGASRDAVFGRTVARRARGRFRRGGG